MNTPERKPINMAKLGERIRSIRESRRMRPDDVAERMSTSRVNYGRYELGKVTISAPDLDKLAGILGVPISAFFDEVDMVSFEDATTAEFYNGLPSNVKEDVRAQLQALHERHKREETTHGRKAE